MDSRDLTKAQAEMLLARILPTVHYLARLRTRMDARRFRHNDRLYRDVTKARDELNALAMTLHYMTCDGTGEPRQ